jgi:hypothetical protein
MCISQKSGHAEGNQNRRRVQHQQTIYERLEGPEINFMKINIFG